MPNETKLAALVQDTGNLMAIASFPFMQVIGCAENCFQGDDPSSNEHPVKVYIHLHNDLIALHTCNCINYCFYCWIRPFIPDRPETDDQPYFKNGVIQMIQTSKYASPVGDDRCACGSGSNTDCCWCFGAYTDEPDDFFRYRPSDCNGIPDGGFGDIQGSIYKGGAFCSADVLNFPLWFIWIGVAVCPSQCGQNPFEGCGPECGLLHHAQEPCRCLTILNGYVTFSSVYVKPNVVVPGSYEQGTLLGRYTRLYSNMPDENDDVCGGALAVHGGLTVNLDPSNASPND